MEEYLTKQKVIGKYDTEKWREVEQERRRKATQFDLLDKKGKPFWFVLNPAVLSLISEVERNRGFLSSLKLPKKFLTKWTSDHLNKEAYYSSHIEGAQTSLEAALLQLNKPLKKDYRDESMQMIANNKVVLEFIRKQQSKPISHEIIYKLHTILLRSTHKDRPITVGKYRKGPIYVVNRYREVVYEGPPASEVMGMMKAYLQWIQEVSDIHPLIKAAMVHLHFVHIHPFDDGNGRSARALSNLYLMNQGYQFINFMAPSDYFDHHRSAYYQAIQNSRLHASDATFFILYYLTALADQLQNVKREIEKETAVKNIRNILSEKIQTRLDRKQIKVLQWMLEYPEKMTTQKYRRLNQCSDETARKDFNYLLELGIIEKTGSGRSTGYILK